MTHRETLLQYLQVMIDRRDWHGVADVAMDLRDIEAEERTKEQCISILERLHERSGEQHNHYQYAAKVLRGEA